MALKFNPNRDGTRSQRDPSSTVQYAAQRSFDTPISRSRCLHAPSSPILPQHLNVQLLQLTPAADTAPRAPSSRSAPPPAPHPPPPSPPSSQPRRATGRNMPSATRAEALVGIPEVIDTTTPLSAATNPPTPTSQTGAALLSRRNTLSRFPPLGPPDMLYTRKRYVPVVGAAKIYGYYHFVRAVDTSHPATISAYIVDVVCNKGLDPLPWVTAGAWEVSSATYTTYNAISNADLTVHVDLPGSTTASATAPDGTDVPLTDLFWRETLVSSFVRDILAAGELPLYPCLRVVQVPPRAEAPFLDAAAHTVARWHLAGSHAREAPRALASRSRIAAALRLHFVSHARFDAAITFFTRKDLTSCDPESAVHAAAAARAAGQLDRAAQIIDALVAEHPRADMAWTERAKILRASGELANAAEAARTATSYADDCVDAWVTLADLYVDLKEHSKAFEALNSAVMPPPTLDPFLRELVPNRKNLTTPIEGASRGTDAVRVLAQRLREEKNVSNAKTDDTLTDLPGKLMVDAEQDCYAVLVKILNDLSWDQMLAVRGDCFVMETDVENGHILLSDDEEDGDLSTDDEDEEDSLEDEELDDEDSAEEEVGASANGIATISLSDNPESTNGGGSSEPDAGPSDMPETVKRSLEKIGKKVCKPWLDYLVTVMYKDLRAMAMWNAEEQQHSATAALAAAALARKSQGELEDSSNANGGESSSNDVEAGDNERAYRRSAEEIASKTKRPAPDWLRRGELALRLGKLEDAKTAFWACVKLSEKSKQFAVTALCRLLQLSSDEGDTKAAMRYADALWSYMDANTNRKESSDPTPPVPPVRKAVFTLISKKGLRAVRDVVTSKVEVDRKRMEGLLLDSVAWKVDGFSR